MDQIICASLSHTHDWYKMGMLKVPVVMGAHQTGDSVAYIVNSETLQTVETVCLGYSDISIPGLSFGRSGLVLYMIGILGRPY